MAALRSRMELVGEPENAGADAEFNDWRDARENEADDWYSETHGDREDDEDPS